jgi:hypothetical protein
MCADLMSFVAHALQKAWVLRRCIAEDKKGSASGVSAEQVEQLWRVLRRAVVECEGNGVWCCALGDDLACWHSPNQRQRRG